MTGDCSDDYDEVTGTGEIQPASPPPEKMGLSFYAALGLIGVLVVMVVLINYPAQKAMAGTTMTQTNWTLQSLEDNTGILVPAMSGTEVTAAFDREGRLSGNAGCNNYFAAYTTKDYQLTITGIGSTKMFCSGPGVMQQESAFLADLGRASSFRVSDSFLKFYDASGKTVLVFVLG
jgi:heat shock protein HslJ